VGSRQRVQRDHVQRDHEEIRFGGCAGEGARATHWADFVPKRETRGKVQDWEKSCQAP